MEVWELLVVSFFFFFPMFSTPHPVFSPLLLLLEAEPCRLTRHVFTPGPQTLASPAQSDVLGV